MSVLSGCAEIPLTASAPVNQPRLHMDCTLGTNSCNQIDAAITRLTDHPNDACKTVGNMARLRYDAPAFTGYGYAAGTAILAGTKDSYVLMNEYTFGGYPSGWGARDNHTYIMTGALSATESDLAGLLAHEEYHNQGEDGPGDFTGQSNAIQGVCH